MSFDYDNDLTREGAQRYLGEHANFKLERLLGSGGMGQVWLASESQAGTELRKVVCKIVPKAVQDESEEMQKFVDNFNLTKDLNHENICPLYGLYRDLTVGWFLAMGYADGQSLTEWFKSHESWEGGLPLEEVLTVAEPLARALDYAHEMKVVHRDIKPQNVMFRKMGSRKVPWLLDFGIATRIRETLTMTQGAASPSGTPTYMALEQCKGLNQDARTDQYSFAVMLYEFLAGHPPFSGDIFALMHQIVSERPADLKNVPPHVNNVLQKALSKDKNARFATCTEFVQALRGISEAEKLAAEKLSAENRRLREELERKKRENRYARESRNRCGVPTKAGDCRSRRLFHARGSI